MIDRKYVVPIPMVNGDNESVYGAPFNIYLMENGKVITKISPYTGEESPLEPPTHIELEKVEDLDWIQTWKGHHRYVAFETFQEALRWKYDKIRELFNHIDGILKERVERHEKRKEQTKLDEIEDKYPELVL